MTILFYALLNSVLRLALTGMLTFKLIRYQDTFNPLERAGMGLMGGSSLLTVAIIMDVGKHGTPFDGWAGSVLTLGALIYFTGRMMRHRHSYGRDWR